MSGHLNGARRPRLLLSEAEGEEAAGGAAQAGEGPGDRLASLRGSIALCFPEAPGGCCRPAPYSWSSTREGAAPPGRRACGPEGWAPRAQQEQVPTACRQAPEQQVAFKREGWTQIMVLLVFSRFSCRIEH